MFDSLLFAFMSAVMDCMPQSDKECITEYIIIIIIIIPGQKPPWYNHTGWLGRKHQFTNLILVRNVFETAADLMYVYLNQEEGRVCNAFILQFG